MNIVEVNHVWKYYGYFVINEDVSMYVKEGEIIAVLDPNGARKNMVMKNVEKVH